MTNDEGFHILREDIASLKTEITTRLDRLNGSVAKHASQIAVLETYAHAEESCGIVREVLKDVEELKEENAAARRVRKIAVGVAGAIVTIGAVVLEYFLH